MIGHPLGENSSRTASLKTGVFQDNLEKSTWHYHNNYELSFILEGTGKRIVGDSIMEFHPGDMVLMGPDLPHVWISDRSSSGLTSRTLEMVYVQFNGEDFAGKVTSLPEAEGIRMAMEQCAGGIQITGETLDRVSEIMLQLPYLDPFDSLLSFLRMMDLIGRSESNLKLAGNDYLLSRFNPGNRRLAAVHDYLMKHYREDIDLDKLAKVTHMAKGSLCRYFKSTTGITVFDYLNRIKIDLACKLLMDQELSVLEVCVDSGFNNLSHFNKQFRRVTGLTPTIFRRQFQGLSVR